MVKPDAGETMGVPATLLVEADEVAAQWMHAGLTERIPGLRVTRCTRLDEARAHLSTGYFRAVVATHILPDGQAAELVDYIRRIGVSAELILPTYPATSGETLLDHVSARVSRALAGPDENDLRHQLEELARDVSRLGHDLNNPLSVISGNAQLLAELARMVDVDPMLARPIQDIEEASRQLAALVGRLAEIKARASAALGREQPQRLG
jgi:signal transduction histidine kinase